MVLRASPGRTIEGRFYLLEEIGRGGMSVVFKAKDLANDGDTVAVKIPLPEFSSGLGAWSLFQREAEIGLRLQHPSIVRFIGPASKNREYVVTEYVTGKTLASRIGNGRRLPEAEALRILSQVSAAVDYLHGEGFVHYDVKPGNVILCPDGSLRLIDFGTAHEAVHARFSLSAPAPPFATSDYMAPEQIRRRRGQTRVDVYALGAMLYEMLTGHTPFEGDDPYLVASAREIGDPLAPRSLCPEISEPVEEIVLRALRRNPAERFATVAEMKAAVDDPSSVPLTQLAERLVPVTPRRRLLRNLRFAAITGLAPISGLVGLFLMVWWWLERRH
ncbi:MAG TPA: serine/threonine-protein kinase [Polyangiaceae bacterium]|nr:serine/threonine-protein kinase [Polyangiaceae bacterium]